MNDQLLLVVLQQTYGLSIAGIVFSLLGCSESTSHLETTPPSNTSTPSNLMVLEKLEKLSSMSHWNEIQNFVAKTKRLKFRIYTNAIHKDLTCLLPRVKQQKNLLLHYVLKVTFNVGRNMHIPVHLLSKSLPFALK